MTPEQGNALFLLVAGALIGWSAIMAWNKIKGRKSTPWVWVLAPVWIPIALWGATMFLYMWDLGLLPWQT